MTIPNKYLSFAVVFLQSLVLMACGNSEPMSAPVPADTGAAPSGPGDKLRGVVLTREQLTASGIELAKAGPANIRETLPLYGLIAPNAERTRDVAARYPGVIRSVNRKVGDVVRPGETMATIESNESLQSYAVTAPLAGVITARSANPGEQTGDKHLFTVTDLSTVWVELALFPRDVPNVHVGQAVRVKSADTGFAAEGKIVYVAPIGTSVNQTLTARVLLDNAERRWAPGLYVTAEVTLSESEALLTIRKEAVQTISDTPVVFVVSEAGFVVRPVKLGRSDGEIAEVQEGLQSGETYAAANSYVLKAEVLKSEAAED